MRRIAATFLVSILVADAQQQQRPVPDAGVVKFSVTRQLVVEAVTVNDKNGKAIEGLKAEDFTVTENGVPQKLEFCEFQKLAEPGETASTPPAAPGSSAPQKT